MNNNVDAIMSLPGGAMGLLIIGAVLLGLLAILLFSGLIFLALGGLLFLFGCWVLVGFSPIGKSWAAIILGAIIAIIGIIILALAKIS